VSSSNKFVQLVLKLAHNVPGLVSKLRGGKNMYSLWVYFSYIPYGQLMPLNCVFAPSGTGYKYVSM
jgi:hypothetical protein